jgi:acyl-CoA synthetase (AMP-forming)/AMP-acid ligase II
MNVLFLCIFGITLFAPPVIIFRFATLQDKTIRGSLAEKKIEAYCRKVTLVWCVFFVLNGGTAVYSVFWASDAFWSLYNGGISYIIMGIIFSIEFLIRKITDKKMPKAVPLSQFTSKSRSPDTVLCYEQTWKEGICKTWGDFLADTARLRRFIEAQDAQGKDSPSEKWILHVEDCWHFLIAFTSLLQCRKQILLTANISPAYIAEIRTTGAAFLTDQTAEDSFNIRELLGPPLSPEEKASLASEAVPSINADETIIMMYTSGTTGKPKVVQQRLTEFEQDNRFVLSKWGDEFLKRKLCSTVSQHHIYGLLFSILLPFTAAVPFCRRRIEFPEEFLNFTGDSYMIITVPAFLKRGVEQFGEEKAGPAVSGEPAAGAAALYEKLPLKEPWIFTSGGVLPPETARKTDRIFGFWPLEVYGSTETSGIAYRQSKNGMEWTPFDNAQISKNDEGCLVVRSPYIKDPAGFITGDMADILGDGRFLLKGRADSIVKIEEKRISLPEVESRLLQSGLVSDVCVVAMEDRRQYLAAALVLNATGKSRFENQEKAGINRYFSEYLLQFFENTVLPKKWRYPDVLPLDAQGKKKKLEIQALFNTIAAGAVPAVNSQTGGFVQKTEGQGNFVLETEGFMDTVSGMREIPRERVLEQSAERVLLEFSIVSESSYYSGHFPEFKLLPAVAQFEIAVRLADRYFGVGINVSRLRRIKFSNVVPPNTPIQLELGYREQKKEITFSSTSPDKNTIYATGAFSLGDK